MKAKYVIPMVIIVIISTLVSWWLSNLFIKSPEDAEGIKYKQIINISPPMYQGKPFADLTPEERNEYFKFTFNPLYFNEQSIDTFDPTEVTTDQS